MILTIALAVAAAAAAPAPKSTDVAQPATAPTAAAATERRYCVVTTNTGTRIPQRDCRTRADWLKNGYDPLVRE